MEKRRLSSVLKSCTLYWAFLTLLTTSCFNECVHSLSPCCLNRDLGVFTQDWLREKIHENTALCCCSKRQTLFFFFNFFFPYLWCSCHACVVHLIMLGLFFSYLRTAISMSRLIGRLSPNYVARSSRATFSERSVNCRFGLVAWVWRILSILSCITSFARLAGKLPPSYIQAVLCHLPASVMTMH